MANRFKLQDGIELAAGGKITEGSSPTGVGDSIEIAPANGANANQILKIYPTIGGEGDHIHLTTGGGTTELYLGNDDHYVKLVNGGDVAIRATDGASAAAYWNFASDGKLTLPSGGDIVNNVGTSVLGGGGSSGPTTVEISATPPTTPVVGQVYYDSDDGNIYICTATTPSVTWVDSSPTGGVLGDAGISLDGGTGTNYWKPTTADGTGTIKKAGAYKTANDADNSLFTFGANGAGTMSVQIEGSMFVGSTLPNNNGGLNTDYAGWLVVQSGAKFGGTINTLGSLQFDTAGFGVTFQDGTTMVSANDSFGTKTGATGVVVHDAVSTSMWVHSSISANFTANFTNLTLAAGTATNITLVLNQGATAYICNAIQIGGVAQTINWQGSSSAPTGNSNKKDVMSFSILNVSGTYTVLGQLVSFG